MRPINTHDVLALGLIYDALVRTDISFNASPGLATSWDSNKAGTIWEFKLRQGVTFHDGKPFTADDVIWSLQRATNPKGIGTGVAELNPYMLPQSFKAVGKHAFRINLLRPNFFLPQFLGFFFTHIGQKGTTN